MTGSVTELVTKVITSKLLRILRGACVQKWSPTLCPSLRSHQQAKKFGACENWLLPDHEVKQSLWVA